MGTNSKQLSGVISNNHLSVTIDEFNLAECVFLLTLVKITNQRIQHPCKLSDLRDLLNLIKTFGLATEEKIESLRLEKLIRYMQPRIYRDNISQGWLLETVFGCGNVKTFRRLLRMSPSEFYSLAGYIARATVMNAVSVRSNREAIGDFFYLEWDQRL